MMKRLFPTALAVLLLLLAGCTAKPDTSDQSKPTDYYLTDTDLPLDDAARLCAAPDFLTAEQQTLYRQAFALYSAMFDGETTGIDDAFPAANCQTEYDEYTPDGSDYTYISSHSRWQSWADFDRVVHALFTDTFWSTCNDDGNAPIYIEHDGRLFILDCAYGDQYYNSNIPDEYIRRRITSADGPLTRGSSDAAGARSPPASDKPPMSMNGLLRCQAKLTQPKAGVAACFAMIPSALNKQPVQPQSQAMGAARRDPRRGEIPVGRCQAPVRSAARQSGK